MKFAPHLIFPDTDLGSFLSSLVEVDISACQMQTPSEEMLLVLWPMFCLDSYVVSMFCLDESVGFILWG